MIATWRRINVYTVAAPGRPTAQVQARTAAAASLYYGYHLASDKRFIFEATVTELNGLPYRHNPRPWSGLPSYEVFEHRVEQTIGDFLEARFFTDFDPRTNP